MRVTGPLIWGLISNLLTIFDKGYDVKAIYEETQEFSFELIIPLK